jgi:arabinan endo-1,5-alpha-L-arabinosidase
VFLTGEGVPIRRSQDLTDWETVGSVFDDAHPAWMDFEWVEPGSGVGAPDIEFFGGRWHLYYHAHEFATNNAVTGHASNVTLDPDDPDYEWIDDGLIMSSDVSNDYSVLDANAVVDEEGVPWMSFGSFWSGIQLVELDLATGIPVAGAPFRPLAARDPWILGVEASSMAYRDGYWYLMVSFGFCCQGVDTDYELRVGRSSEIAGPYVDIAGQPMLENGGSLLLGASGRMIGPGSGDLLVTDQDSWLVHHWYDAENDGETTLGSRPVLWSPEGWPVAAEAGFVVADPDDVDEGSLAGAWTLRPYAVDESVTLLFESGGVLGGGLGGWSYDEATGVVSISIEGTCAGLEGSSHLFIVGAIAGRDVGAGAGAGSEADVGFGYSDAGSGLRAERTEEPSGSGC